MHLLYIFMYICVYIRFIDIHYMYLFLMDFRVFNSISLYTGSLLYGSSSQSPAHCCLAELCLNSFSRSFTALQLF